MSTTQSYTTTRQAARHASGSQATWVRLGGHSNSNHYCVIDYVQHQQHMAAYPPSFMESLLGDC